MVAAIVQGPFRAHGLRPVSRIKTSHTFGTPTTDTTFICDSVADVKVNDLLFGDGSREKMRVTAIDALTRQLTVVRATNWGATNAALAASQHLYKVPPFPRLAIQAGLVAEYDARDPYSLFTDTAAATPVNFTSDVIGAMLDRNHTANHLTQATAANKPTWDATNRRVNSDGSNDMMEVALSLDSAFTLIARAAVITGGGDNSGSLFSSNNSPSARSFQIDSSAGAGSNEIALRYDTSSLLSFGVARSTTVRTLTVVSNNSNSVILRLDGTQVNSAAIQVGLFNRIKLFQNRGATQHAQTNTRAIALYSRALSTAELQSVEAHVAL